MSRSVNVVNIPNIFREEEPDSESGWARTASRPAYVRLLMSVGRDAAEEIAVRFGNC